MIEGERGQAYVFAGANASGKSTFIAFLLENGLICAEYVPVRKAEQRCMQIMRSGESLILETVFSTKEKLSFVHLLKAHGYHVTMIYTGTQDVRINAAYLANRVLEGGHDVPIRKMIDRRERSLRLAGEAVALVDCFVAVDNSFPGYAPEVMFSLRSGKLCFFGKTREVDWFKQIGIDLSRIERNQDAQDNLCRKITEAVNHPSLKGEACGNAGLG